MFDLTFEEILERMLERVPSDMDKREGSIIYDALAPAALELSKMYIALNGFMTETFGDTASREYLIRRASERGIIPEPATKAILKGRFNIKVPIGSRFSLENLNYTVKELIELNDYKLKCEQYGTIGNEKFGQLIPIDYIDGLESAELIELLIPGEDDEDTEVFRKRYFKSFSSKAYGGNKDDYLEKTNKIQGVGATKVTPVWSGGGTVKLTILNSEFNKASTTLIETVQNIIDPTKDGTGVGIAPIGHVVTVDTVDVVDINIKTKLTFDSGYNFNTLKSKIEKAIEDYLVTLRQEWATKEFETIVDIENTRINDSPNNLKLTEYQIGVLGGVVNVD